MHCSRPVTAGPSGNSAQIGSATPCSCCLSVKHCSRHEKVALLLLTSGVEADGVVAAVVAKFKLERFAAKGLPQNLVPHADAKDGFFAQDLLGIFNSIGCSGRISLLRAQHT